MICKKTIVYYTNEEVIFVLTIGDILTLELLPWYKNLTNMLLPKNRPIEYVSVNDLPLDDFIRTNEMVISIATPYIEDTVKMEEFISGLIDAKASLFLLATPSNSIVLSDRCIKLAENGKLPILMIPWEVRFADICETVLERLHEDYNESIEITKKVQRDILNGFLSGMDIRGAAEILSKGLNSNVSITDSEGNVIGGSSTISYGTRIALESNGHLYGNLFIDCLKTQKWIDLIRHTLAPVLSLWFYREEIIETTQSMAKDELIWSLANGKDPNSEKIQRTAKLMHLHLNRTYVCIVGRMQLEGKMSNEWQKNWLDTNITSIKNAFEKYAERLGKKIMVTHNNNIIITYLEVSNSGGKDQVSKFLGMIETHFKSVFKKLYFSWGISEIKEGSTDYRNYYLHAKLAEELCSNDMRLTKRYYFENTLIYNMMSILSSDEDFMKYAYDIIAPVIEYDKTKSVKLIDTLRVFLSCKNISKTARILNRHRQTLLYQLEKIEDLTGMSLKNNDEVFLLETSMRLQVPFYFEDDIVS